MRFLVTGCAGFIGSHVSERLVADGHDVVGVDAFIDSYERSAKEANLAALRATPRFAFHEVDLRAGDLEPLLHGVDVVINEAALAGLARSWTDLAAYAGHNLVGLGRLLDACRAAGVARFVQASTSSVYGRDAVGDEANPTRPVSPYGVTKLAAEHLLAAHSAAWDLDYVVLRYFSVCGPRQRPDMAYHRFIEAMLDGRPITVFGDGRQSRSNTYVGDVVEATLAAARLATRGSVYNIGGALPITLADAVETIALELGVRPQIRYESARPGDQLHTAADTGHAQRELGFEARVSPAEALALQVAWHRARRA
jgi:nucleoside-diphosphate-sugar epimerase